MTKFNYTVSFTTHKINGNGYHKLYFLQMSQGKGFSKDYKVTPRISKEASKCLKESSGNIEIAQSKLFQENILKLKSSDPQIFSKLSNYNPADLQYQSGQSSSNLDAHEKLVEVTWDTVASYLPLNDKKSLNENREEMLVHRKFEMIAKVCCSIPNASVLDVGCGDGSILPFLKNAGADISSYTGIDLSSQMIRLAKEKYPKSQFLKVLYCLIFILNLGYHIMLIIIN